MAAIRNSKILLETGTNELEVLEFTIAGQHFGINVSKVREITKPYAVTPMPNACPFVEGIFKPREELEILTLINLGAYMGLPESETPERDIFIITNFNNTCTAFHVHTVESIHKISWEMIDKPDSTIYGGVDGLATGIARINGKLVTIVDFEKIMVEIGSGVGLGSLSLQDFVEREKVTIPIMVCEDSSLLEQMLTEFLKKSGYSNIIECSNGKEAWDALTAFKNSGEPIKKHVACIITDIEMPKMDGHRLTKLIKEDPQLKEIPVIIFSSLINQDMRFKGEQVGANAQVSKADIHLLLGTIEKFIY